MKPIPTPTGPLSRFLEDPWELLRQIGEWVLAGLRLVAGVAGILLLILAILVAWRAWRDRRLGSSARLIRILPPPGVAGAPGAEMLWMSLHAVLRPWWRRLVSGQPHLAWEVVARPEHVEVGLWVPRVVPPGLVERAVDAAWPGARAVEASGDPLAGMTAAEPPGSGRPRLEVTELELAESPRFPVGTPGQGALALVLAGLTGLADGESATIQVVGRPATSASRKRLLRAAWRLKVGARRARRAALGPQVRFLNPAMEHDVRALLEKAASPLWHCLVRVAVSSPAREAARGRIHGLAGAFAVYEGRNGFRRRRFPGAARRMRRQVLFRPYLLSVPELAQIATLPSAGAVEGLERPSAGIVAPPRSLPSTGKVLGTSEGPAARRPVAISVEDARHHMHVVGETGTGKSTLFANLVLQDAAAGRSAVVIDPKGDLVEAILGRLPAGAEERTCVLDPDDTRWAVGLNVLAGEDVDLVVDHILAVFTRIFEPWWGPRTDDIMRAACLTLKQLPGTTLAEVPILLTHPEARQLTHGRVGPIVGLSAFWDLYEGMTDGKRHDHIAPLLNKLRAFLLRGPLRAVVGQSDPKLDVGDLLDRGGLLLVRIPKGTLGEHTSRLLGAFVVARVWQACMRRARRAEADRPDTTLYVDEMQNYLALPKSFEDLLAEARGYRLSLVLAHQHLGQLPREMRDALGANARNKLVFACSPEDARILEDHFRPLLTQHDLSNLAAYQAACRPSVDGGHGAPFTFRTSPLGEADSERAEYVRKASAEAFAEPREAVDTDIQVRLARFKAGEWEGRERPVAQPVAQPALRSGAQPGVSQERRDESAGGGA